MDGVPSVAPPPGVVSCRPTVRLPWASRSANVDTVKVRDSCPAANDSVPDTGAKSTPGTAVPAPEVA